MMYMSPDCGSIMYISWWSASSAVVSGPSSTWVVRMRGPSVGGAETLVVVGANEDMDHNV